MTLLDIKKELIRQTGRLGLVVDAKNDDYDDNGILFHIQAGQRFLNRLFEYKGDRAILEKELTEGDTTVTFDRARYVEAVWVEEEGGVRMLEYLPYRDFRLKYPEISEDPSVILHWTNPPEAYVEEEEGEGEGEPEPEPTENLVEQLLFQPAASEGNVLRIHARWYSPKLVNDTDENFWTIEAPELLVDAARMSLENRLHRNIEGAAQFAKSIVDGLNQIHNDMISEEAAGPATRFRLL